MKKAAMFGLDARISLAIFGALSVISGAALYSAIQQGKVIAVVTELEELGKAYEQYILDVGSDIPTHSSDSNLAYLKIGDLVSSTATGWKGPYIGYERVSDNVLEHPTYGQIGMAKHQSGAGTNTGDLTTPTACIVTNCETRIYINGVDDDIAKAVDRYIDGEDGYNTGRIILSYGFTGGLASVNTSVSYKIMPALSLP